MVTGELVLGCVMLVFACIGLVTVGRTIWRCIAALLSGNRTEVKKALGLEVDAPPKC